MQPLSKLILLVDLRGSHDNTLRTMILRHEQDQRVSLLKRDGVALLSDRLAVFDRTRAHAPLVQVCALLESKQWPYLLIPIPSEGVLASGKLLPEVAALLKSAGVEFVAQDEPVG